MGWPRAGFAIYAVLVIVIFLTILSTQFHKSSLHVQRMTLRFEESEMLHHLAEAGMEEAHKRLVDGTADPESEMGRWLINRVQGSLPISLDLTNAAIPSMAVGKLSPEVVAEIRLVDFRNEDADRNRYFGNEGNGTLEIKVTARNKTLLFSGSAQYATSLIHHYEYVVVGLVTPRDNLNPRDRYSQAFPLDYVLLVRDGLDEFRRTDGYSLNHPSVRMTIEQPPDKRKAGKIYFGGTNSKITSSAGLNQRPLGNYVFLNMSEKWAGFIPRVKVPRVTIQNDDVMFLFPNLLRDFQRQNDRIEDTRGWQGIFECSSTPVLRPVYQTPAARFEERTRQAVAETSVGAETNIHPGFEIFLDNGQPLPDQEAYARAVFEGDIRQRFLYRVAFRLDSSNAEVKGRGRWISAADANARLSDYDREVIPCAAFDPTNPPRDEEARFFIERLPMLSERMNRQGADRFALISTFTAECRPWNYPNPLDFGAIPGEGGPHLPQPRFFNIQGRDIDVTQTGGEGFFPYGFFSLWGLKRMNPRMLEKLEMIKPIEKMIQLRGISHVEGELTLGEPGQTWTFSGQGVLSAQRIKIAGSLKKRTPKDLLVLFCPVSDIVVQTSDPIEAVLIATRMDSLQGQVTLQGNLNLKGGLIVDQLGIVKDTPAREYHLTYDPLLKTDQPIYQSMIQHTPIFRRLVDE